MKAKIYHNPMCGTSRKTLEILRDSGFDVWIHEYLKTPPTREELKRLYEQAGIPPRAGLRPQQPLAALLGMHRGHVSEHPTMAAMVAHPVLSRRPRVQTGKGARPRHPH